MQSSLSCHNMQKTGWFLRCCFSLFLWTWKMLFWSSGSKEPWCLCLLLRLFWESLGKVIWKDLLGCHEKRYAWRSTGEWMRKSYFSCPNCFCMFSCAQFQVRLLLAEQRQEWQDKQEACGCFDIIVPLILSSRIRNREICSGRKINGVIIHISPWLWRLAYGLIHGCVYRCRKIHACCIKPRWFFCSKNGWSLALIRALFMSICRRVFQHRAPAKLGMELAGRRVRFSCWRPKFHLPMLHGRLNSSTAAESGSNGVSSQNRISALKTREASDGIHFCFTFFFSFKKRKIKSENYCGH